MDFADFILINRYSALGLGILNKWAICGL